VHEGGLGGVLCVCRPACGRVPAHSSTPPDTSCRAASSRLCQGLKHDQLYHLAVRQLRLVSESDPWAQDKEFLLEVRGSVGKGGGWQGLQGCTRT
jgi:hypothetical protein